MAERGPSRTAQGVAFLRAVHQIIDEEPKILDDPISIRLFDPEVVRAIREQRERFQEPRSRGLRTHMVVRSRFCEDQLREAVQRGLDQYVILGAGMDTFTYRQPDWARSMRIFEVDHPASQQYKLQRLTQARISIPENSEYVPIDFESDTLKTGLARSSLDINQPVFFSWLGVTMYLTSEAVEVVMQTIGSLANC
jgi:methyltransferase (TIGR00027 family)